MEQSHLFCIAPMMDWTDRHDRYFLRQITKRARLYTEMLTTHAILFGDRKRLLEFDPSEHPLALQIGGADPLQMAESARIAESWGYDEVNINIGCPSDRVQAGRFGACLMKEQDLVAKCIEMMKKAVSIPVTVKCRIGIDEQNPKEVLPEFITLMAKAGCEIFIIHARKAILSGLSPVENRNIPPLDYPLVYGVKINNPNLKIFVAHGGGYLPAYSARIDHAWGARPDCRGNNLKHKPSEYLKRMYFDTVVFSFDQLKYLVDKYGADHIIMGTDYPYDMAEDDPIEHVMGTEGLSKDQIEMITGGNACSLFKIK